MYDASNGVSTYPRVNSLTPITSSFQVSTWDSNVMIKKSEDGFSLVFYASNQYIQLNESGKAYHYAAIGGYDRGGLTEWIITSSGTWGVPKTGKYMLELYGGGGSTTFGSNYQGGSSCQYYDSINLTKGDTINVTIGKGLNAANTGTRGGTTIFGSYSVLGGEKGTDSTGGSGAGNRGTNGQYGVSQTTQNNSTGILGQQYGYGVNGAPGGYTVGGPGAVYLKYLGT